jgi:hypothetical protein
MISILPEDIVSLLQEYLLQYQWKQFIKSSRCLFSKWKSKLIYRLKDKYSREYYFNENGFREQFLSTVEIDPKEKLVLSFISPLFAEANTAVVANLRGVNLLNAYFFRSIESLSSLTSLTLNGCHVNDFACLGTVRYLDLSGNIGLTSAKGLGNVYHLDLSECEHLVDISELGQNHYFLNLSFCHKIIKVNHLKNVHHTLILSSNLLIEDISELGNIPRLNIRHCTGLRIISSLPRNHELMIARLSVIDPHLIDFTNLFDLHLTYCETLKILQPCFGNIPYLSFFGCNELVDISVLGKKNIEVDLSYCSKVMDISNLSAVKKLNISYCPGIKTISDLTSVKWLIMKGCKNVLSFGNLVHSNSLQRLDISGCDKLKQLIDQDNTMEKLKSKIRSFSSVGNYLKNH